MKVFKTPGFKYVLFLEFTLIFSAIVSICIFFVFNLLKPEKTQFQSSYEYIYDKNIKQNYQLVNQLLDIKINEKADDEPINSQFMNALLELNRIEETLNRKGNIDIYQLVTEIPRDFAFIKQKKEYLYCKWLYLNKRYEEFVLGYQNLQINKDELDLLYINSMLKLKKGMDALNKFKGVFKKTGIHEIKRMISPANLQYLINNLEDEYWKIKLFNLVDRNLFSEFIRIKSYIKDMELHRLIYAFFRYRSRDFKRTRDNLSYVKSEKYLPYKHALLAKIKIRNDINSNIENDISMVKKDQVAYNRFLLNLGKLYFLNNKLDDSIKYLSELIKFYEFKRNTQDPFYWKLLWMNIGNYFRMGIELNQSKITQMLNKGCNAPQISIKTACQYWINKILNQKVYTLSYPYNYYSLISNPDWRAIYYGGVKNFLKKIKNIKNTDLLKMIVNEVKILLEKDSIQEILKLLEGEIRYSKHLNKDEKRFLRLIMAVVLIKKQNYNLAFKKYIRDIENIQEVIPPFFIKEIFFPLNYKDRIDYYSSLYNLDPFIVYSIIREESFFSKTALSYAGANGLMQLMPETANKMREKDTKSLRKRDLHSPELNISLGTKYLRFLLDRYDNKLYLALAAYNAGTTYVDRWISVYPNHKKEEFIESIPVEATRVYVKKIFRDYFFYSFYYNKSGRKKND